MGFSLFRAQIPILCFDFIPIESFGIWACSNASFDGSAERWGDLQALFETITGPYEQQVRQELLKEQAATV